MSILTPSFGQARWLADNLVSVERQTFANIEHVVMDGGSTDGSIEILERHARPALTWRSEPDEGQSHALNKAFSISRGSIIGWLNSDDAYFGPTIVEEVVRVFAAEPDIGVVYGHAVLANADGLVLQVIWAPPFNLALLRLHDFILQPTVFMRREILGERLVDESFDYTMDYELWLRLAQRHRFRRIDRIVAVDRHHPARKSYTMLDVGRADHARLERRYGLARGPAGNAARKAWKIASRLIGTIEIRAAVNEPVVFPAIRDGALRLLVRQVATRRERMTTGDPSTERSGGG